MRWAWFVALVLVVLVSFAPRELGSSEAAQWLGTLERLTDPVYHGDQVAYHIYLPHHATQPSYAAWCSDHDGRWERDGEMRLDHYRGSLDTVMSFGIGGAPQWDITKPLYCSVVIFDDRSRPPEELTNWLDVKVLPREP